MNTATFTKSFDDLQKLGREWARQALLSSAKTFEATARYLDGLATKITSEIEVVEETAAGTNGEPQAEAAKPEAKAETKPETSAAAEPAAKAKKTAKSEPAQA